MKPGLGHRPAAGRGRRRIAVLPVLAMLALASPAPAQDADAAFAALKSLVARSVPGAEIYEADVSHDGGCVVTSSLRTDLDDVKLLISMTFDVSKVDVANPVVERDDSDGEHFADIRFAMRAPGPSGVDVVFFTPARTVAERDAFKDFFPKSVCRQGKCRAYDRDVDPALVSLEPEASGHVDRILDALRTFAGACDR